jgi:hypothetical protein
MAVAAVATASAARRCPSKALTAREHTTEASGGGRFGAPLHKRDRARSRLGVDEARGSLLAADLPFAYASRRGEPHKRGSLRMGTEGMDGS